MHNNNIFRINHYYYHVYKTRRADFRNTDIAEMTGYSGLYRNNKKNNDILRGKISLYETNNSTDPSRKEFFSPSHSISIQEVLCFNYEIFATLK
jgi:hypothetical protein